MAEFVAFVECALEYEGKFLFIRRPQGVHAEGLLAFPGGKVEYADGGEGIDVLMQAVKREVLEELGIDLVDPIRFVTSQYFIDSRNVHVLDVIFHCKLGNFPREIRPAPEEVPEYFWLTTSELMEHKSAPIWLKHYVSCINKARELKRGVL